MTIDVQLTWPGLAEALKEHECVEVRAPRKGEQYIDDWGNVLLSDADHACDYCRPILTSHWRFPSDKLPGAVCIAKDGSGWLVFDRMPKLSKCGKWWNGSLGVDIKTKQTQQCLGLQLPTPTGDPAKDIWLNPDHPTNKE